MTYEVIFHLMTRTPVQLRVQAETPEAVRRLIVRETLHGYQWLRLTGRDSGDNPREVSIRHDQLAGVEITAVSNQTR